MSLTEAQVLPALMKARSRLSAAAWLVVRDTHAAEDIFQNVALKAMTREVTFDSEAALISWAFITTRREAIDWLRRHHRESVGLDDRLLDQLEQEWQSTPAHPSGARLDALRECLAAVPESARQLLKLRYFDGHGCEIVARELGLGLDTVYKRLSRLHASLRGCVEGKLTRRPEPS